MKNQLEKSVDGLLEFVVKTNSKILFARYFPHYSFFGKGCMDTSSNPEASNSIQPAFNLNNKGNKE